MNKLDKKKEEIAKHYNNITLNLAISFLTSVIGGLVSAILIAVIFGQTPSEIYKNFGIPLLLWGCFLVVLFFIFFFIFWLIFVLVPRSIELKRLEDNKNNMEKRKGSLGFWGWLLIIGTIPLLGLLIYLKLFDTAFKFFITMFLLLSLVYSNRIKVSEKDYKKIEKISKLCELKLNKYQNWSILLMSLGFGALATGLTIFKENYAFTWVGLLMVIVSGLIEKFHVEPRYNLLEKHYSKHKEDMIQ